MTNEKGVTSSVPEVGRVKWFNNAAGYGFITVSDGNRAGTDIFVHHSGIRVTSEQYKYLVQGEYVQFTVGKTDGGKHEYQADNVCGINGGKLMCETRRDFRDARTNYKSSETEAEEEAAVESKQVQQRRQPRAPRNSESSQEKVPRPRGRPPKSESSTNVEGKEWTMVKAGAQAKRPRSKAVPRDA
jgi:CspA family cold shock protein